EYNGIKLFGPRGYKLPDQLEDEIEALMAGGLERPTDDGGSVREVPDADERYLSHLVSAAEGRLDGMRVVVDCANGAASVVAPEALRRLGAEVVALFDHPDGH